MFKKKRKAVSIVECTVALSILIVLSSTVITSLIPLKSMSKTAAGDNIITNTVYDLLETFRSDAWVASDETNTAQEDKNIRSLGSYFFSDPLRKFKPDSNTFLSSWTQTGRYTVEYSFPFDRNVRFNPNLEILGSGEDDARYMIYCTITQNQSQRAIFISAQNAKGEIVCELDRAFVLFDVNL